jgi:hypothetical protein
MMAALALVLAADCLRRIARADTDLPPLAEMARDARDVYLPALSGKLGVWNALLHDHAPGLRVWKLGWLALNGQWDDRLLILAAVAVQLMALGVLFLVLARVLERRMLAMLAVAATGLLATPALTAARLTTDSAWAGGFVGLSLLHLGLMGNSRARSRAWWLGCGCGALNVLGTSAGIASAAALAVWSGLAMARDRQAWRPLRAIFASNGALLAAGLWLIANRSGATGPAASFFPALLALASSQLAHAVWVPIVWAPAIICIVRWLHARPAAPPPALALLAVWSLALLAALAAVPAVTTPAVATVLATGLIINGACLAAWPADDQTRRTQRFVAVVLWTILVGNALFNPRDDGAPVLTGPAADSPITADLRRALIAGDASTLRSALDATTGDILAATEIAADPALRRVLPDSIRPPLALAAEAGPPLPAFHLGAAPALGNRCGLPAYGTWTPSGVAATGEFVSTPLETESPFLQIRVCGTLRPPSTSLVLRTASGSEVAPFDAAFVANDHWKQVNFAVPRGRFRIVARSTNPAEWFAFTAPVEVGRLSRLARKLPGFWPWVLATGLVLGSGSAVVGAVRARPVTVAALESAIAWRVVPWLGLFAYAVFFSHHLDSTAGPNDSGGYLNSAKLLVAGRLTAMPRTLFGPGGGATDPALYRPSAFVVNRAGQIAPEYPVGFPLEIWAVAWLTSLEFAVPAVILLQLVLGVVFTRQLARAFGLPDGWAWLTAGLVGLSPVYVFQALQPLSDGPALVWVTAAVLWAWTSREKPWHALLAGLATALAVLIRPANVLCLAPVLVCLAGSWRRIALWMVAGLPGAVFLAWYNHTLFGSWHATGYGDMSSGFGAGFILPTLRSYAVWLPELFTPLVVLAIVAPFVRSVPGRVRLVLTTWVAVYVAFYAAYWCTWDHWYNMRFVMPAAPAMLVLALLVLQRWVERGSAARWAGGSAVRTVAPAVVLVAALFGWLGMRGAARKVLYWTHTNREHAVAPLWARDHLPADAVVFARHATGSLMYYTSLTFVRTDRPEAKDSPVLFERIARAGRPVYAITYHWETRGFRWENAPGSGYPDLPGTWDRVASLWDGDVFVWKQRPLAEPAHNTGG